MASVIVAAHHQHKKSEKSWLKRRPDDSELVLLQNPRAMKPVEKLQLNFRVARYPQRLCRKNLAERLKFESSVLVGTARLINQIMVFALLVGALRLSSDEVTKRGIYSDLGEAFEFEWMNSIQSRDEFVNEGLPMIAAKSKEYFTLSSRYFQPDGIGSMMLLRDISLFTNPKPGPRVTLQTPEFSFTAWVKSVPQFSSGYVVRKQGVSTGDGAGLSCWGWYLHAARGPELHYGFHDFFDTSHSTTSQQSARRQVEVGLVPAVPLEPDSFSMLTMIVREHDVTFYQDRTRLGSRPLPRKVTDCFNNGQGTLLGGASLELGVVRYFPMALTDNSIEELFSTGGILADLSTGSDPEFPEETDLAGVERSLSSSISNVDAAVDDRQALSELSMTLKIVQDSAAERAQAPEAPTGPTFVTANATSDAMNPNRTFTRLVEGPWRLTRTVGTEEVHRTLRGVPSFHGTGATLMFWYRHMPCREDTCGVFLFTARSGGPESRLCWSLWVEDNGIWFDNLLGEQIWQYPQNFVADKFKLQDNSWRHLAMVFDETTDMVRWYMDGVLAVTVPWGSAVTAADCEPSPDTFITFGRNYPGFTYGAEVEVHDLRLYVHPLGAPLQDDEIRAVAEAATPALEERERCQAVTSPLMQDSDWTDTFGHDCSWYHNQRQLNPAVCQLEAAADQCPIACKSRQECLSFSAPEAYFTWDRIRKIETASEGGTICLRGGDSVDAAVQRCRAWVAANPNPGPADPILEPWLDSFVSARGRRVDLRQCELLRNAIDPHCSFNEEAVRNFTRGVKESNGDFTIAFWIKSTAAGSLIDGKFIPHVQFYADLSPPTHNLAWGLWLNANGEARLFSACGRGERDIYENIEMNAATEGEWTFIAFTRTNSTMPTVSSVATNLGRNVEESTLPVCLYDEHAMFNALEFNYDALVSPLMMVPEALPFAAVQELYLSNAKAMNIQTGPLLSNAQRAEQRRIPIEKEDFQPRSVLTAPPIVFKTMIEPSRECDFAYASEFIQEMHGKVQRSKCAEPYVCPDDVLQMPERTLACPGGLRREGTFFGLSPNDFNSRHGYADFLYSITDNRFLFREGKLMPTNTFISSLTESVSVTLVFFTPKYGTTSLMTFSAEFQGAAAAEVAVSLEHFEILEGVNLEIYLFVQSIVLVSIVIMIIDITINTKDLILRARRDRKLPITGVIKQVTDTATCGMVIVFVAFRIPSKMASADKTEELVGGLSRIPWDSLDVSLERKKEDFFDLVVELTDLIATESELNTFCNIILIVSLLRVIQCTDLHPRLALLTGTLVKATDDLFHAALLIGLLMGCFAGIATWRFGSEIAAFGSFQHTMQTQFEMLFGSFPEGWQKSTDLMVYTILYIVILFLLVQNFLLAIIVEAYMKVREDNDDLQTEEGFVQDVWNSSHAFIKGKMRGWPSPDKLGKIVESWTSRISVGMRELHTTGEFRSMESIGDFLTHYSGFEFLKPPVVKDYYFFEEPSIPDKTCHKIMLMLDKKPTLRKEAEEAFRTVAARGKGRQQSKREPHARARRLSASAIPAIPVSFEPDATAPPRFDRSSNGRSETGMDGNASQLLNNTSAALSPGTWGFVHADDLQAAGAPSAAVNIWKMREEVERRMRETNEELTAVRTEMHGMNRRMEEQTRRMELSFNKLLAAVAGGAPALPSFRDDPIPRSPQAPEPSVPTPYPYSGASSRTSPPPAEVPWGRRLQSLLGANDVGGFGSGMGSGFRGGLK